MAFLSNFNFLACQPCIWQASSDC